MKILLHHSQCCYFAGNSPRMLLYAPTHVREHTGSEKKKKRKEKLVLLDAVYLYYIRTRMYKDFDRKEK